MNAQALPMAKQGAANQGQTSGLRQVKHPSHTQMLNAIGINQGPIISGVMKQQQPPVSQTRNLSVGRQGTM